MTNFDPGGFLVLLTVIPAVVGGALSTGLAYIVAWLGYGEYEPNVVVILGVLIVLWIGAALVVSTNMLVILAVALSMLGAYLVTRNITASSYGWVLGVVLFFVVFIALSNLDIYQGVDETGRPQGIIAQNLYVFYATGLFVCGAIAGTIIQGIIRLVETLELHSSS